jgi:hypothetical protein
MLNDMVTIQEAVRKAKEFAQGLFEVTPGDLRLEEIDSGTADGLPVWLITLSMPSGTRISLLRAGQWNGRDYKTFAVTKENGDVLTVKIREFAAA